MKHILMHTVHVRSSRRAIGMRGVAACATGFVLVLAGIIPAGAANRNPASDRVEIRLQGDVSNAAGLVVIGDIAEISGGTPQLKLRIARIDICAEHSSDCTQATVITANQVYIRCRLAGLNPSEFHVTGAHRVELTWHGHGQPSVIQVAAHTDASTSEAMDATELESLIMATIRTNIADRLGVTLDEIEVFPTMPLHSKRAIPDASVQHVEVRPYLPLAVHPGRLSVRVAVYHDGTLAASLYVLVDAKLFEIVPVATNSIPHGHSLGDENVRYERRAVKRLHECPDAADLVDHVARRSLPAGQTIRRVDLKKPSPIEQSPVIVRPRDAIRLVGQRNNLLLTIPVAEALDSGREGEFIRVRNPQSGRTIRARVVSASEARFEF